MSYCRFSNADIYVYPSDRGYECCGCPLEKNHINDLVTKDAAEMIRHMDAHRKAGHDVPWWAIAAVFEDRHMYADEAKHDRP